MEAVAKKPVVKDLPALRFSKFTGTWKRKALGSVCTTFKSGEGITASKIFEEGEYPVYGGNGLRGYADTFTHDGYYLLIGRQGALCGNINRAQGKTYISEHAIAVEGSDEADTEWLAQRLDHMKLNRLSESSAQPGLAVNKLVKLKVYFPTLPEQQKIAGFLSAVDARIQQLTRKKALLEQYKKGVMQQLFSQQIRFTRADGSAFAEWEWVGGNLLFSSVSDKNHNSDLPILAITQDQGAIPRDMIDYKMTVTDQSIASYKVVQVGDFVISLRTFQGGIEYSSYKGICSPAYIILRPKAGKVVSAFYKDYLKTGNYIMQLQRTLEGIRDGKMISYKYFSDIKLPLPSLEEQQKIAGFLGALDARVQAVGAQLAGMQRWKKGLLQGMFV